MTTQEKTQNSSDVTWEDAVRIVMENSIESTMTAETIAKEIESKGLKSGELPRLRSSVRKTISSSIGKSSESPFQRVEEGLYKLREVGSGMSTPKVALAQKGDDEDAGTLDRIMHSQHHHSFPAESASQKMSSDSDAQNDVASGNTETTESAEPVAVEEEAKSNKAPAKKTSKKKASGSSSNKRKAGQEKAQVAESEKSPSPEPIKVGNDENLNTLAATFGSEKQDAEIKRDDASSGADNQPLHRDSLVETLHKDERLIRVSNAMMVMPNGGRPVRIALTSKRLIGFFYNEAGNGSSKIILIDLNAVSAAEQRFSKIFGLVITASLGIKVKTKTGGVYDFDLSSGALDWVSDIRDAING